MGATSGSNSSSPVACAIESAFRRTPSSTTTLDSHIPPMNTAAVRTVPPVAPRASKFAMHTASRVFTSNHVTADNAAPAPSAAMPLTRRSGVT